ncbi:MAG: ATP-binding cassette domain-containing protein, partial [Halioglobus sp.]|nr:ATP-binding cassette domain-containing protein [Halioglobus sp.]
MNALLLEQVSLRINGSALFPPLSLRVEPGTVTSVIGPSGSGKSSLLHFMCGVLPPDIKAQGILRIGEEDLTALPPQSRRLGLLFQDPLLFP